MRTENPRSGLHQRKENLVDLVADTAGCRELSVIGLISTNAIPLHANRSSGLSRVHRRDQLDRREIID